MNFESSQQKPSEKNPFENENAIIKGAVDFIMSAKEVGGDNEGWTAGAGRVGFAQTFLEDFSASQGVKDKILEQVKILVEKDRNEHKEEMSGKLGITGQEGQGKRRNEETEWRRQHGA